MGETMGNPISTCTIQGTPTKIVMLGLDAAGERGFLNPLKGWEVPTTTPTVGPNIEHVVYKGARWEIVDIRCSCSTDIKNRQHFSFCQDASAVVFIVDSADTGRISDARLVLENVMDDHRLCDAVLLVFANKQDLHGAMGTEEVADRLGLFHLSNRDWHVQGLWASGGNKVGAGLYEGFDWLYEKIQAGGCWHPATSLPSPPALDGPGQVRTSKDVLVWDQPGGSRCMGVVQPEIYLDILEVDKLTRLFSPNLTTSSPSALTYGRIDEPIAGWIAMHCSQVRGGTFVVTLRPGAHEQGRGKVLCYNMAGEEIASLDLHSLLPQTLAELEQHVGKLTGRDARALKLASPNGIHLTMVN